MNLLSPRHVPFVTPGRYRVCRASDRGAVGTTIMQVRQDGLGPYREMHAQSAGRRALQGTYEGAPGRSAADDTPIPCPWNPAYYSCTVAVCSDGTPSRYWLNWACLSVPSDAGFQALATSAR